MRALRAVAGSWKTTESTEPMCLRSSAVRLVTSLPLKKTLPEVGG